MPIVDVLVASYNGENFLPQQLDSLVHNGRHVHKVFISDAASSDGSWRVLLTWVCENRKSVPEIILSRERTRCSAKSNFTGLLERSVAGYIAFCDQDDVWHPEKLTLEMAEMQRLEALHPGKPVIVHSDLEVVDATLKTLSTSFFDSQRLPRVHTDALDQMVQNNVTGCTLLINRAARDLVLPIPPEAIMHDWWIAAKVRYHDGIIGFVDRPLVKYRQHGANVIGAKKLDTRHYIKQLVKPWGSVKSLLAVYRQARAINPGISAFALLKRKAVLTFRRLRPIRR